MALADVFVRLIGAGSCGIHRHGSFRSGSGSLTLASMAPLHGGALTLQAGIGLTCKVVVAGHRMVVLACGAAGLDGGDAPLDPEAEVTLPHQLKSVADKTLSMGRELRTAMKGDDRMSVAEKLGYLRDDCKGLVEALEAGTVPDRAASITLLGLQARIDVLLELFDGSHASLEESTKKFLLNYMAQTVLILEQEGVRAPPTKEVAGDAETSTLRNLLKTLANNTTPLLKEVGEFYLRKDVTLPDRLSVSVELNELRDRCEQLIEEVTAAGISDHGAVGTLLGIHARFRIVLLFCIIRSADHPLEAIISAGLATSLTDRKKSVEHYVKKTGGDAAEEVE